MQNNWKSFAYTSFLTALLMSGVLFWDYYSLKADVLHWSYILLKTVTIGSYLLFSYLTFKTKKLKPEFEDAYLILFFVYSWYGMAYIDMTYNYSFIEAALVAAILLRQSAPRYLSILGLGFILLMFGYAMAKEPAFIAPGESYKSHSFTITTIFFVLSTMIYFLIRRYQLKVLELNEKFALIGKQSSFLMHEIKTPLNRVMANSENLVSSEILEDIKNDSQKISGLVASIETLIHRPEKLSETFLFFDLDETREALIKDYRTYLSSMNINYDFTELSGPFYGNKHLIYQALKNLLINSVEAIGFRKDEPSLIKLTLKKESKAIHLKFSNTNSQIGQKDLKQIFNPHYTTKENDSNKGMGLTLVKNIIEAHRGNIQAYSKNNETIFEIKLPDLNS